MAISFKTLIEQYKFSEDKVLKTLKAAQIVDSNDPLEKVRDRQFSEEVIENGFKLILDYFKTGVVPNDDFAKAEEYFKKQQADKAVVAKQVAVTEAKIQLPSFVGNKDVSALSVQSPLMVGLAEFFSQSGSKIPEDQIVFYSQLLEEVSNEMGMDNPALVIAEAVLRAKRKLTDGLSAAFIQEWVSRPVRTTVEMVMAQVKLLEEQQDTDKS